MTDSVETMDDAKKLLSVRAVAAGYDDLLVLDDVSLEVRVDETVAILGPNGHGKTTLLRAICGLNRPWSGEIWFDGTVISGWSPDRIASAGLVYVPQGDLLFGDMTVYENLLVGGYLRRAWRKRRERLEVVWELFPQLEQRRRAFARSLSGGERRMLAIGRALMSDAKLMMIDEPSLGLAPVAIDMLYSGLAQLYDLGVRILLVEEMADRVGRLADRLYLLDAGKVVAEGPSAHLLEDRTLLEAYLG